MAEPNNTEDTAELRRSWDRLWGDLGAKGDPEPVFNALTEAYSSGRAYHNLTHVRECIDEVEKVRELLADPNAVEFALWFHDARYDTMRQDNEERSADWAASVARGAGLDGDFAEKVRRLILATKHFNDTDNDAKYLSDIDLSILGKSAERFDTYNAAIAAEYSWVQPEVYKNGRKGVLEHFGNRDHIYMTKAFQDVYEARAKANIERTVAALSEGRKKIMAVYAGSFDPPHIGHEWIINRAAMLFDDLVVVVAVNPLKRYTFTVDERVEMLKKIVGKNPHVQVTSIEHKFTARYAKSIGAGYLVEGVRDPSDLAKEQAQADWNKEIEPGVETVLLMRPPEFAKVSSSAIKMLMGNEGWEGIVKKYVVPEVFTALSRKST
ncbi:MAG: pantetheine-phosphate adenylyltransferase [Candidatus Marsarchaeota archaeon]|nr:pantetheine-phosphate adenylyltransferase [Candidatus Marsarchaeota archaeon]